MNNKFKILVVEDEHNIRSFVKTILEANGYQALLAANGKDGRLMLLSHRPDLVILDLGLPDMDGMEFIKVTREDSLIPILVLSARTEEHDKVAALDAGANDYVTKPFGTEELLARVRAMLRNIHQYMSVNPVVNAKFSVNGLEIDYEKRIVTVDGREVTLTQTEYNIVVLLSEHAGRVMTYNEIIQRIWGWSDAGSVKKLQVNMAKNPVRTGILRIRSGLATGWIEDINLSVCNRIRF